MGNKQPVAYDAENDYVTTKATASKGASVCPACNSTNYVKVGTSTTQRGQFNVMRCYDCGYPVVAQSGADPTGAAEGASGHAEQVHGVNNYQPTNIIGRA
jgi:transposase-like protein